MIFSNIAKLPTKFGFFYTQSVKSKGKEHLLIFTKDFKKEVVNVRIHSECLTGDTFGSLRCDCQEQLHFSLEYISKNSGLIIYLRQEGRGIGLFNKINAYYLQDKGFDTIEANLKLGLKSDAREYSEAIEILNRLGIKKINLLTNNPKKLEALKEFVVKRVPIEILPNKYNKDYIKTKKEKMGHLIEGI